MWLAPLIDARGWPFSRGSHSPLGQWPAWLLGRPLAFWRDLQWTKQSVPFLSVWQFDSRSREHLDGLLAAHRLGHRNEYAAQVINSWERFSGLVRYVSLHGTYPVPVVLLQDFQTYAIADGCHRLAALFCAHPNDDCHEAWVANRFQLHFDPTIS